MRQAVERVRGFYDVDAVERQRAAAVARALLHSFRLADFQAIDVPIVEHLDLYLRKNGAQVLPKVYAFADQGKREVALRPEFTASVIRACAAQVGRHGGTLRVSYAGPVFRYEKPQRATGRQFTQVGVELLGGDGALDEAELLALACRSARAVGIERLRLVIGHLGPLRALLRFLEVDSYAEHYLLEHLEYFNRGPRQQAAVRRRLGLAEADLGANQVEDERLAQSLAGALRDATPEEARGLVGAILDQMGVDLTGSTRTPEEILDRVLMKARRHAAADAGQVRERLERALLFVEELGELRGDAARVLAATEDLLARFRVPVTALDEVRGVLRALQAYDLDGIQLELAPAMARGIAYYSGLIFEMYATAPDGSELQICGGGRYDGLAQALTGQSCPAIGFAFGVERVLHVLPPNLPPATAPARVAILATRADWHIRALRLADTLREHDLICAVRAQDRSPAQALAQARRAGYAAAIALPGADGLPSLHVLEEGAVDAPMRRVLEAALRGLQDAAPGAQPRVAGSV